MSPSEDHYFVSKSVGPKMFDFEVTCSFLKSFLNKKGCEVNAHLTEMCKERRLNLINHSKKIKRNHLNRGKLYLNQKGPKVLGDAFFKQISNVFN